MKYYSAMHFSNISIYEIYELKALECTQRNTVKILMICFVSPHAS